MPKRSSNPKGRPSGSRSALIQHRDGSITLSCDDEPIYTKDDDPNVTAFNVVQRLIGQTEESGGKNPAAVALGRRGGLKGGPARAASMTKKRRSEIAKKAAAARWGEGKIRQRRLS